MKKDDLFFVWVLCLIAAAALTIFVVIAAFPNPSNEPEHAVVIGTEDNAVEIQLDSGSRVFVLNYGDDSLQYGDDITVQLIDGYYEIVEED